MHLNRRNFLKSTLAASGSVLFAPPLSAEKRNGIPYRDLGKTGEKVSLLCLGGFHIGQPKLSEEESIRLMRTAVDEGVNFFDNAWKYHNGVSEKRMGKALKDGYREKVFLMTKHWGRDAETARKHLEDSLRRLDTDVIDLLQVHEIIHPDSPEKIYTQGVIEEMLKAKEEGKIRYLGFTGHHYPSIHLEMMTRGYPWDTVQMPLNVFDWHYRSFTRLALPEAVKRGIGVIGMKSMGGSPGVLPRTKAVTPEECLRYTMSLPVATVCSGIDSMEYLRRNIETVRGFSPMTEAEMNAIREQVAAKVQNGIHETYKTAWHKDIIRLMQERGQDT